MTLAVDWAVKPQHKKTNKLNLLVYHCVWWKFEYCTLFAWDGCWICSVCHISLLYISACCPPVSAVASGNISIVSDGITTTALFICANGYNLIGEDLLTCRSNGLWDIEQPHCCKWTSSELQYAFFFCCCFSLFCLAFAWILRWIISNEGSKPEILSRIAQTTAALSRLKIIWRDKNISLASKVKLMRMLILSTFLYACESWTLTAEIERRIQALEMRCYRGLLNISYKDHVMNNEVCNRIQNAVGVHDDLLTMVKKRKLRWYGHISRSSGMLKTVLQGTVKGARRRGRQKKRWEDNIKEWTGMGFGDSLRAAEDREGWKGIVATSSAVPWWPPRLKDWDERWDKLSSNP